MSDLNPSMRLVAQMSRVALGQEIFDLPSKYLAALNMFVEKTEDYHIPTFEAVTPIKPYTRMATVRMTLGGHSREFKIFATNPLASEVGSWSWNQYRKLWGESKEEVGSWLQEIGVWSPNGDD